MERSCITKANEGNGNISDELLGKGNGRCRGVYREAAHLLKSVNLREILELIDREESFNI